jgi:excisionase family DNA binding protein
MAHVDAAIAYDEVLSLEEAAARLKIAPKTMREWLRTGKVEGFKAGKLWRVRASALPRFIHEATQYQQERRSRGTGL